MTTYDNADKDNSLMAEIALENAKDEDAFFGQKIWLNQDVEKLRHERLVESCEGTPICAVAEIMGGDNYTN